MVTSPPTLEPTPTSMGSGLAGLQITDELLEWPGLVPSRRGRKYHRQHGVGRVDAAVVMAALRHDLDGVLRAEFLVDVLDVGFAPRPPRRALSHRRTR